MDIGERIMELRKFDKYGTPTVEDAVTVPVNGGELNVPVYINEFWTAKQRAGHSLHEISYRACFKSQLPEFFITRLTAPEEIVYDPFMGRGTTLLEAGLLERDAAGCDCNPLSPVLVRPRFFPQTVEAVRARMDRIDLSDHDEYPEELLVFYHPDTLREVCSLKKYLLGRINCGDMDEVDEWLRMVAVNRLTGHSNGFLSVYTMPPNQAVSVKSQIKINERRNQTPPLRKVRDIILKKSRSLVRKLTSFDKKYLNRAGERLRLLTRDSAATPELADGTVRLVVTSPPFLNVVDYAVDNWLRCWFIGVDADRVPITMLPRLEDWTEKMRQVFLELHRLLTPGGWVAFEVGEVNKGTVRLEEYVIPAAHAAGLRPVLVLINSQTFTKTANCWGVSNNSLGTNTNRIVLLGKE